MNVKVGVNLIILKFLVLAFMFLALMPPFSFANLGLASVGVFASVRGIELVIKKNEMHKIWIALSGILLLALSVVRYASH